MENYISVSFGELTLKGKNRHSFEKNIINKILKAIKDYEVDDYYQEYGKFYLKADPRNYKDMIEKIQKVFGIVYISPCIRVKKDVDEIVGACISIMEEKKSDEKKTFKVFVNRVDKSFRPKSPELAPLLGGKVLEALGDFFEVDINKPEIELRVDIKENAYIYIDRYKGWGGLPLGSSGKGLLLLSGGIDSPVAGIMMAKRGVEISCIHFHSYPYTSPRAFEKTKKLVEEMAEYLGKIKLYAINLLPVYTAISKNCKSRYTTIISRRFMMKIAEEICRKNEINAMVTGESLGQVASQTIQGVSVVNEVTDMPILRPLIAFDKTKIIEIAKLIGTYETSIEPFDDCCSVFSPDRPATKPRLSDVKANEDKLDIEDLVEESLESLEIYEIGDE